MKAILQELQRQSLGEKELVSLRLTKRQKTVARMVIRQINAKSDPLMKAMSEQDFYKQAFVHYTAMMLKKHGLEEKVLQDPTLCSWISE